MKLTLVREIFNPDYTLGSLYDETGIFCYTLEDPVRDVKIPGKTAIPYGCYPVDLTLSRRFGTVLPILEGVPNFTGVRIHAGNTSEDTEGCILVGWGRNRGYLFNSRAALKELMEKLEDEKDISIEITDEHPERKKDGPEDGIKIDGG